MRGKVLSRILRTVLQIRDSGITGEATGFRIAHSTAIAGESLNAQIRSLNRASQSGERLSAPHPGLSVSGTVPLPPVTRAQYVAPGIQNQPVQFGAVEISCLTHSTTWYSGFSG